MIFYNSLYKFSIWKLPTCETKLRNWVTVAGPDRRFSWVLGVLEMRMKIKCFIMQKQTSNYNSNNTERKKKQLRPMRWLRFETPQM